MESSLQSPTFEQPSVTYNDGHLLPLSPEHSADLEQKYAKSLSRIGEYSKRFLQISSLLDTDDIPTFHRINAEVHERSIRKECKILNSLWRMRELNKIASEHSYTINCDNSRQIVEDVMNILASKVAEISLSGDFELDEVETQLYDIGLLNSDENVKLNSYYSDDFSTQTNPLYDLPGWLQEPLYQSYIQDIRQEHMAHSESKLHCLLAEKVRVLSKCDLIDLVSDH